jgi:hypothetical protein
MHWRTYQRLRLTALEVSARSWFDVLKRYGRLRGDQLDGLRNTI